MSSNSNSPCGTQLISPNVVRFETWSPSAKTVDVEIFERNENRESLVRKHALSKGDHGFWSADVDGINAGALYRYSIDGQPGRPDPRSRFQPFGVHGPSQVIDPQYAWTDSKWTGVAKRDLVIYELHVGSFTEAGTYEAATNRLPELVDLGVTAIELLPLVQTPGRWNWGYDGVNFFAPRNTYGSPESLKAFVDSCHAHSIAVINDVVYNHIGPEGNYLSVFAPYISSKRGTPWGDAFNFDGEHCEQVRRFILDNIAYWIQEYHFDGVRLDAVHYMFDDSEYHILDEIRDEFKKLASGLERSVYLIGESNIYDAHLVGDVAAGELHHDAIWSDCVMHSIYAVGSPNLRLTNRQYEPHHLAEALEHAYVFCAPEAIRATPEVRSGNHPSGVEDRSYFGSLIMALQTHDSVGNHPHGTRLHQLTSVEFQMAAAPLILLYPSIPMIFMGEEVATDCPFPFFADFEDEGLRKAVDRGRRDEYPHHDWKGTPLPSDELAFTSSRVNTGREEVNAWYRELLKLRRQGVSEGWLVHHRFFVESQPDCHVYRLKFNTSDGQIHVAARLDRCDASATPLSDAKNGQLLMDSLAWKNRDSKSQQELLQVPNELAPQQCLIWLSK